MSEKSDYLSSRRIFLSRGMQVAVKIVGAAGTVNELSADTTFVKHQIKQDECRSLRVAACQILTYPEVTRSVNKIQKWIEMAARDRVDVVTFPEACLCGYAGGDFWKTARPEDFIVGEQRVIETAKKCNIAVVLGTLHWDNGNIYNDLLVIDKGGIVQGRYSKTHLVEHWAVPGRILPIYNVAGVKSCFIICHDIRYPELVRLPSAAGAQICYFSSHESGINREDKLSAYRSMPISRATENTIFCVMCNAPTNPKTYRGSHGNSKIIHPDGNVLIEAGFFEERLVAANIRIKDASRNVVLRATKDQTILKNWLNEGVRLVAKAL